MKNKYAKLLLIKCLGLKEKRPLFIDGNEYTKEFIEIVKEEAQKLGIDDIYVRMINSEEKKLLSQNLSIEEIKQNPLFDKSIYNEYAEKSAAFLMLSSFVPNLMDEIDSKKLTEIARYERSTQDVYRKKQHINEIPWCIACIPNIKWADHLFKHEENSLEKLWGLIFDICLINAEDPILEWNKKIEETKKLSQILNNLNLKELKYKNKLGTNLSIKLPENHVWCGGTIEDDLIVNMPTYEIFTSPLMHGVNGVVYNSKPLIYNNILIENFRIEFKDGKIIDVQAEKGLETLLGIINTDENSCYLGEVALVEYDSLISNTKVVFEDTLLDENASCHLAIGSSYPECIKGAEKASEEELLKLGVNSSKVHVDFMIGTEDLEIIGIDKNNNEINIFKDGNFSLKKY